MSKRVGVFDSGIGGFSILRELFTSVPNCDFFYIADREFCPYGEKSSQQILQRCLYITEKLLEQGVEMIVMACNTATAHGIDALRQKFPHIEFVGVEPYLNAINLDNQEEVGSEQKWLSLTTLLTSNSERYRQLLKVRDPAGRIETKVLPELVPFIEKIYADKQMTEQMKNKLIQIMDPVCNQGYNKVILGCTHYPLIKNMLGKILKAQIIDPSVRIALRVEQLLISEKGQAVLEFDLETFHFYCTEINQWEKLTRNHLKLFERT